MAVPAYTNDLIDWIADSDTTAWLELTNAASGGVPDEADTESALQGTNTVSQATNTTSLCSMCRILGASVTLATNDVFLVWHGHGVATAMLSYASGGLRLGVATTLADWKAWAVGGNDVSPFPYAKWVNNPVDPTITGEYTNGTPPAALTFFGVASLVQLSAAVSKGQPHVTDIIRYGRAQSRFTGGETANYCVFSGFAAANDASTARWGLIQSTAGGYLWKGLMKIGLSTVATTNRARTSNVATLTTGAAHGFKVGDTLTMTGIGGTGYNATAVVATVPTTTTFTYANTGDNEGSTADTGGSIDGIADFRDSNTTIFIQDTRKVYATFNKIEIRNASTNVAWTGINFANPAPSTNASNGDLEVVDNATVVLTSCTFTDMATFIFLGNSDAIGCQFLRCGRVTSGGGLFNDTSFLASTVAADEGALYYDINADPDGELDGLTFTMGANNHHAIRFGTSVPATMTLRNCTFTGFSSSDDVDGSVFRFDDSNQNITLNLVSCTTDGAFSVDDAALSPNTVTINIDPVTTLINIKDFDGNNEAGVRVYLEGTYVDSGSHTGANNASVLTDSGQSWTTDEFVGQKVVNTTDGSAGTITANTATTITATLAGGTDNDWDTNDNYIINADLPVDEPVTISRGAGTTATVTHTGHGMNTNEYIKLAGITNAEEDNSGAFQITITDADTYTYTSNGSGTLTYTGDMRATGATIYGTTDASGNISSSRTYSSNQPITGYARKSDDGVNYFKAIELDDTVNNSTGLTINRRLVSDGLV